MSVPQRALASGCVAPRTGRACIPRVGCRKQVTTHAMAGTQTAGHGHGNAAWAGVCETTCTAVADSSALRRRCTGKPHLDSGAPSLALPSPTMVIKAALAGSHDWLSIASHGNLACAISSFAEPTPARKGVAASQLLTSCARRLHPRVHGRLSQARLCRRTAEERNNVRCATGRVRGARHCVGWRL